MFNVRSFIQSSFNEVISAHKEALAPVEVKSEKDVDAFYKNLLDNLDRLTQHDLATLHRLNLDLQAHRNLPHDLDQSQNLLLDKVHEMTQRLPAFAAAGAAPLPHPQAAALGATATPAMSVDSLLFGSLPHEMQESVIRACLLSDLASLSAVSHSLQVRVAQVLKEEFQKAADHLKASQDPLIQEMQQLLESLGDDLDEASQKKILTFWKKILDHAHFPSFPTGDLGNLIVQMHNVAIVNDRTLQQYLGVLQELNGNGGLLGQFPNFQDDAITVRIALAQCGRALAHASARLQDDPQIVKIAVTQDGQALEFASARLQDDPQIVKMAVAQDGHALYSASKRLQDDPQVVKIAVAQNGGALEYVSDRLQGDPQVVKIAVAENGYALQYASDKLKDDDAIVKIAVAQCGEAIQFASARLQQDPQLRQLAGLPPA